MRFKDAVHAHDGTEEEKVVAAKQRTQPESIPSCCQCGVQTNVKIGLFNSDSDNKQNQYYQTSITATPMYSGRSLEELRCQEYKSRRKNAPEPALDVITCHTCDTKFHFCDDCSSATLDKWRKHKKYCGLDFSNDEILVAELLAAATRGGGAKGVLSSILSYV